MNKKAITFGITFVLIVVVAIGTALYFFVMTEKKALSGLNVEEILEFEHEKERIKIYAEKALDLAKAQAFYKMTNTSLVKDYSNCFLHDEIIIWQENCEPTNLKEWFSQLTLEEFSKLMQKYPERVNLSFEEKKIKIKLEEEKNNSLSLVFSSEIEISFELEEKINMSELEEFYQKIKGCKEKSCIEKISLKDWELRVEEQAEYIVISLESKKEYFFINEIDSLVFEKLKIKAAIKK